MTDALQKLAITAADAGLIPETTALLEIARRRSSDPSVRFELANTALQFLLNSSPESDSLALTLAACLQQKTRDESELDRFCKIVRDHPQLINGALAKAREIAPPAPAMEMLITTALASDDFSVSDALETADLTTAILDITVDTLTKAGSPDLAINLYHAAKRTGTRQALSIDPLGFVRALAAQKTPESRAALSEFAALARTGRPFAEGYGGLGLAPALDEAGLHEEAAALYEKCAEDARYGYGSRSRSRSYRRWGFGDFVKNYAIFQAKNEQNHRAEEFLSWSADIIPEAQAAAIIGYAETAFPKVDFSTLSALCSRLQLPSGLTQAVLARAAFQRASSTSHENE